MDAGSWQIGPENREQLIPGEIDGRFDDGWGRGMIWAAIDSLKRKLS